MAHTQNSKSPPIYKIYDKATMSIMPLKRRLRNDDNLFSFF